MPTTPPTNRRGERPRPDHGPRISGAEYDRRVVALHAGRPPRSDRAQELALGRAEMEAAIDYRLGQGFPGDRREALWRVQKGIIEHPVRALLGHMAKRLVHGRLGTLSGMQAAYLVERYARVLDHDELIEYFDLSEDELERLLKP